MEQKITLANLGLVKVKLEKNFNQFYHCLRLLIVNLEIAQPQDWDEIQ